MKTRVSGDERYLVWINGASNLSIVNISDFTSKEIKFFWRYKNHDVLATCAALNHDATRIVGIGLVRGGSEFQTLHIFDGSDSVTIFESTDITPNVQAWVCLEVSIEGDIFFVGGASSPDFSTSVGHLMAFTFDENAELLYNMKFGHETGLGVVNSIRRHPEGNILFIGCRSALGVVLWHKDKFFLLNTIPSTSPTLITDLAYNHNTVYAVSEGNQAMAVNFDYNIPRASGSRNIEAPPQIRAAPGGANTLAQQYQARESIPPKHAHLFRDYDIRQINLPNGKKNIYF